MIIIEVLRLENLSKFYTTDSSVVVGLTGVSLSFSTGEFVALTGESGSGKSTLAHVLSGILPYESGELYIYGQPTSHYDAYDWSKYRRDLISFISQSYGILPGNTVTENVESALILSGLSACEAKERTSDILDEVELTEYKNRKAGKLSSGQKQRLSIARALAKPSKILIADEPTGNLDRENSEKIISLLKRASSERLVILITHEFDEAKDAATRRIILSDGAVVTDAKLADVGDVTDITDAPEKAETKGKKKALAPYVTSLTLRSRPVFTAVLCLLLAVTMFISFVFVGNFIIALDDTSTRIYESDAFFNSTHERLIVMRSDGKPLTDDEFDTILSYNHVENIERYGYVNDLVYHYRDGIDLVYKESIVLGPGYDAILNPDAYTIETKPEFTEKNYRYVKTLPYTGGDILVSGRAPESVYEVVSADPDYAVGDTVKVYIRNINAWAVGAYLPIELTVVGTTEYGYGLYFSDELASALSNPAFPRDPYEPHLPWGMKFVFLPYDSQYEVEENLDHILEMDSNGGSTVIMPSESDEKEDENEEFVLADELYLFPGGTNTNVLPPFIITGTNGETINLSPCTITKEGKDPEGNPLFFGYTYYHKAGISNVIFLSDATFERFVPRETNQIGVYIEDYSYTERVTDALTGDGYITVSPYKLGSTKVNEKLAQERLITLAVCAATFIISFVLELILLRTMFASLHEYYKLMSSTGMTAKTASIAVSLLLFVTTVIGEAIGIGVICLLNASDVTRVVNIFKYLDAPLIVLLFCLHFLTVLISLPGIHVSLKRAVFGRGKSSYDIDFTLMEEDAK